MKDIAKKFAENGIKASMPRIAIYKYLSSTKSHPSADMVYNALHESMPSLSRTTIYNTLRMLCDNGLARMVSVEDEDMRFDADVSTHIHFKCSKCGKIIDIYENPLESKNFLSQDIASVESMQIVLTGICKDCK